MCSNRIVDVCEVYPFTVVLNSIEYVGVYHCYSRLCDKSFQKLGVPGGGGGGGRGGGGEKQASEMSAPAYNMKSDSFSQLNKYVEML